MLMRLFKLFALTLPLSAICGCGTLQGSKLVAPESFGLISIAPDVYIETNADSATRAKLLEAVERAREAVRETYGSVISHPIVNACVSESCYVKFGGRGSIAKVYFDRILLSPRGLNWHFLAHEWSHAEMRTRLAFWAWWWRLPQWFDEGVAVTVSQAPEHSEDHWNYLLSHNIPYPTTEELHALRSLRDWNKALDHYGEKNNTERRAKGEVEIRPVYTAAGHEVRLWLAKVGTTGLLQVIENLNGGEKFEDAYHDAKTAVESSHLQLR
ncbi:hypothetical protein [Geomesophilobacter sediminis]|uniref:Peptidase M48 domain-containing protein n=1 Tax=Geomesophilobacter sediminis TaxID=2798584 RepID=A0A8J7LW80_9BACT|nr:hypothetical protein [Geomesophilobacter sediminis]MBJ6726419.1 hypothetical protein [Geomesophilobacter sediminis]